MLTLFSWGYWGWGNATTELIRAIDATERGRGFRPPIFFDIRASRSVRAKGFCNGAFEQLLPKGRYYWYPRLGNARIKRREGGIQITDPFAAKILLDEAIRYAQENRRIIFFCACEFPCDCHRRIVARLVLAEAERIGRKIRITEWPGGSIKRTTIKVTASIFAAVTCGARKSVPIGHQSLPLNRLLLPWGTILELQSEGRSFPVLSGPARFRDGWELPVLDRRANSDSEAGESRRPWLTLRAASEAYCKSKGLEPLENLNRRGVEPNQMKALTIQQPSAEAVIHLGKDVENRSWRSNYKGTVLIHAAAKNRRNAHELLGPYLPDPPAPAELESLPKGAIIGVADLFDYVQNSDSRWAIQGQWHWLLRNVRSIKPIACSGRLRLWTPSAALIRKLPEWVKNRY